MNEKFLYSFILFYAIYKNSEELRFIQFDICDYYGSISEKLFGEAVDWAKSVTFVSDDEIDIMLQSKRSLLFDGKDTWKRKLKEGCTNDFNIGMGSFDGAESTDLIGLYLLSKLKHLNAKVCLYRDDGLLVTSCNPKETEEMKKELHKIFKEYGLRLDVNANQKKVDFLDVTLDLTNGLVSPHMKENNTLHYIDTRSNHPPTILANISKNVNDRITRNSSNAEIFNAAIPPYKAALAKSGHNSDLKFDQNVKQQQQTNQKKRNRNRKVTWFNPPYSKNVKTKVGKRFLQIVKDSFPPSHKLYKICNRNTLKLSYRTMPNMKTHLAKHNNKILRQNLQEQNPETRVVTRCCCQKSRKAECPMPGQCYQPNAIYRAQITTPDGHVETYTGSSVEFHGRWLEHRRSFNNPKAQQTTASTYIWSLKNAGIPYEIKWSIIGHAPPFNPKTWVCRLCVVEKYYILFEPRGATLNQRSEFFAPCYHRKPQLLKSKVK